MPNGSTLTLCISNLLGCSAKAYPGNQMWKCYFGQYVRPFIRTPHLIHLETVRLAPVDRFTSL